MKKFFKQKLFWGGFLGILLAVFIFTFAFMGSTVNPIPKELPIAVVVQDEGVTLPNGQQMNFGEMLWDQMENKDNESVEWMLFDKRDKAVEEMNNKKYYAAIVIPSNLSQDIFSLLTRNPVHPEIELLVNEGMNVVGSNIAHTIAGGIVSTFSQQVQQNLYEQVDQQQMMLSVDQAKTLADPMIVTEEKINKVGSNTANGNVPAIYTQILWITTFIGSMLLFTTIKQIGFEKWTFTSVLTQLIGGLTYVLSISGMVFWLTKGVLDVPVPNAGEMFLLLLFTGMMFFLIQGALINWLGYAAAPIFVLLFFFSMPVLTLAPEMLPNVTRDWLYSWVPFRYSVEAFKDTLFFGVNPLRNGIGALGLIGLSGLIFMFLAVFKPNRKEEKQKLETVVE